MTTRILTRLSLALILGTALVAGLFAPSSAAEAEEGAKKELVVGRWYPELEAGLALTQGTFSDNWYGGDKGSIVWSLIANGTLESQMSKKANWRNTLKLAFGQTHQQRSDSAGARYWEAPEKSTDLIELESLLRLTLGGFVDPFAAFNFQSQFQDASDPAGRSLSFNPLQFRESAGIARQILETEDRNLLSRIGFAFRQNVRKSFTGASPSTSTESESTLDGGIEWVTDYRSEVLQKRISWTSKLTVYQPVFYSGKTDLQDLSQSYLLSQDIDSEVATLSTRIGSDWENIFTSQITKVISVSLYVRWIYDAFDNSVKPLPADGGGLTNPEVIRAAVRKAGQFKETLSLGITYRFL